MMNRFIRFFATFTFSSALLLFVPGCETSSQGSKTYTRGQAQQQMDVYTGTVLNVAQVTIEPETTGGGAAVGGIAGGVVGSTVGSGGGRKLATLGGALAGSAIGSRAEQQTRTKAGLELEVELDDGRIIVVVQEEDDVFAVGDRVRVVVDSRGVSRVRQ